MDTFKFPEVYEFDIETAKLVLAAKTGKIVTKDYHDVTITNLWEAESFNSPYPIQGYISMKEADKREVERHVCWTLKGEYCPSSASSSPWDLMIMEL